MMHNVYVNVYVYVYAYVYVYVYAYVCVCVYMRICVCVYMCICVCISLCICIRTCARTCIYVCIYIYTYIQLFCNTVIYRHKYTPQMQAHKHPAGPETVLMKIEFYKKNSVLPQRGNQCCHLKSGKFGRPNLGVFGQMVFSPQ